MKGVINSNIPGIINSVADSTSLLTSFETVPVISRVTPMNDRISIAVSSLERPT